jgi:5'-3' exonuclease
MRKFLILDGNNACWRLMKRLPVLTADNKPIQVVYGMLRLLKGSIEQFEPNVALVCWDSGHSEYRKNIFPGYKAHRTHDADPQSEREFMSFLAQIDAIKKLLRHLNIAQLEFKETEADDLIAIACAKLEGRKIIVSSDNDMLQLVNENIQVWSPIRKQFFHHKNFKRLTGLSQEQYLQMKALIGDSSDGIPGVARGFGQKTATSLLAKYESLEKLFTPEVEKKVYKMGNRYKLLYTEGAREIAYRNLLLMDLSLAGIYEGAFHNGKEIMTVATGAIETRHPVDRAAVKRYFLEQSFKSLIAEFGRWVTAFENLDTK